MNQTWLPIYTDQPFSGYLSLPPSGQGPGIVLIQEIWGVNEHIRTVADQYALAGFVVLAPDVFWRLTPRLSLNYDEEGNAKAFECYSNVDLDLAQQDMVTAVQTLKSRPEVTGKVAVMGYCLGGMLAYRTATATDVDATVCYYGGGIAKYLDAASRISAPILFHHGALDEHIPTADVQHIKQTFADNPLATFYDYPEAGHGFNCWGRPYMYHQPSAPLAQGRTLMFLAKQLYS
ncbi:dienelactone hydrolase family protein [Celerinatantimonas sp. YJH-8]|uniref:dienelactone hydrolase family protein n=1 Tax=Celerinatantimonas sp. YJH-8 TaxID=3228714 RepID=UPI0038C82CB7